MGCTALFSATISLVLTSHHLVQHSHQDNAPVHTTEFNLLAMRGWGWTVVPYTTQSPDTNPQEDVWNRMTGYIDSMEHFPRNKNELRRAVHKAWVKAADPANFCEYMKHLDINIERIMECNGGNRYRENKCKQGIRY